MKKGSTESRLIVGFAAALTLVIVVAALQYRALERYREMSRWVNHTYIVLATLDEASAALYEAETNQRGYLLTDGELYLQDYRTATEQVKEAVERLRTLVSDNPTQSVHANRYRDLALERLALLEETIRRYSEGGLAGAQQRIKVSGSRSTVQSLLTEEEDLRAEENRLLLERSQQAETDAIWTEVSGAFIVLLALVGIVFVLVRFRHETRKRREREMALQDSEALLQEVLEIMPVGVFWSDAAGDSLRVNQAAKNIWGGSREVDAEHYVEYKGWWPDTGKPLESKDWALARTLRSGETIRNELVDIQGFDDSRKTIIVNTMPIRDAVGRMKGAIAVNLDVTEVKRAERELEASARTNETKRLALALFTSSLDRKEIFDRLLALLSERHPFPVLAIYVYDEWQGLFHCQSCHGLTPDISRDFAPGEGVMGEAVRAGKLVSIATSTLRIRTGVADFEPAEVVVVPIAYQGKQAAVLILGASEVLPEGYGGFLETLGEQLGVALHNLKQYDDLKLLMEQLRSSGEEIQEKNRQLEEASRMKSEFLANMSHELRTPLNAIIGFSEVLKDGLLGDVAEEQLEYVNDIFDSGTHLLSLINDILDLSKVEAGKMQLLLEPASVDAIIEASVQIVKERAHAHNLTLKEEVQENLGEVLVDERKVKQILFNLLSNAAKFTPEGGSITLAVRKVGSDAPDGGTPILEFRVIDTGIGISEEDQAKLFQPFVQIDSALSRRYEGTGLGLAMVRRLAELHGGSVELQSEVGVGSTFIVRIPWRKAGEEPSVEPEVAVAEPRPIPVVSSSGDGELVLVVEDDARSADLMRVQLEKSGRRIIRAPSAEIALDMLAGERPDLIIMDILLPGMDGWELLEKIKMDPSLSSIPVVIVSIIADNNKGMALGASQVLQKPVSREALLSALRSIGLQSPSGNQATVLVIDDDPKSVQLLSTYFSNEGYRVLSAYRGREGIDLARKKKPELIVLDLMMPELSGFDVVEALSKDPETASIPIIVVTAKQITSEDRERLNGDVVRIIEKSDFNPGYFMNEIHRALKKRGKKNG